MPFPSCSTQIIQYELWGPNNQLGKKEVPLKDIAEGGVAVEVDVFGGARCTSFVGQLFGL
jgi:hypothetical protein